MNSSLGDGGGGGVKCGMGRGGGCVMWSMGEGGGGGGCVTCGMGG